MSGTSVNCDDDFGWDCQAGDLLFSKETRLLGRNENNRRGKKQYE